MPTAGGRWQVCTPCATWLRGYAAAYARGEVAAYVRSTPDVAHYSLRRSSEP